MAIISGAQGIVYFVHEFSPVFREDAVFRYPDIVTEVTKQNRLIRSLAKVLNSPDVDGAINVHSIVPIATLTKQSNNLLYLFTVSLANAPSQARFTLHGYNATKASVLGESRELAISGGAFEDKLEGYGMHIYVVSLSGSIKTNDR